MSDIFISYASEDRDRIKPLAHALEREGWSVWWERSAPSGWLLEEVIEAALDAAQAVVVVWPKTSVTCEWVLHEARKGLRRGVLFSVRLLEEAEIPQEFEHLKLMQLTDWRPNQDHVGFDQFVKDLAQVIGAPSKSKSQQPSGPQGHEPPSPGGDRGKPNVSAGRARSTQSRLYLIIAAGLLVIVGSFVGRSILPSSFSSLLPRSPASSQTTGEFLNPERQRLAPDLDPVPMVPVSAGEFMMGSGQDDLAAQADERPVHFVYLEAFSIDQYEVTAARYAKFFQETKRSAPKYWSQQVMTQHGQKPVVGVDWKDASAYCSWAGKRLPTEAEWEKAARGTDQRLYPWGNVDSRLDRGNFDHCCDFHGYEGLTDIGTFEEGKSFYGVYDMAGNVWEWVADWYDPGYYGKSPARNPEGPSSGEKRVLRGGAWDSAPTYVRSAYRLKVSPNFRLDNIGFRCARTS